MQGVLEQNGTTSSTRVGMLLCVATACVISVAVVVGSIANAAPIDPNVPWLVGGLLSAGFGGKVWQKGKEPNS